MLQIKCLNKLIDQKKILHSVNFTIKRGSIAIFLGGSGVGKSTLLRVLNNLEPYENGEFYLDDRQLDLTKVSQEHTIGMVFQHFNLFEHLTVEENITLALIKQQKKSLAEAKEIAQHLLERYGLIEKAHINVQNLSGGQKQRVALARTLALNPQIICLDEPTSALDPTLTLQVASYIQEIALEGRIVLLTTHDMHLVNALNATLFLMENGTIVETCSTDLLGSSPENYPKIERFLKGY